MKHAIEKQSKLKEGLTGRKPTAHGRPTAAPAGFSSLTCQPCHLGSFCGGGGGCCWGDGGGVVSVPPRHEDVWPAAQERKKKPPRRDAMALCTETA